jgi:hypothetical protein
MHYLDNRGSPSQDALTAARVDWNIGRSDRIFFRVRRDLGHMTFYNHPITAIFDNKAKQTWWQGQAIATHTFSPSAASQFLVAFAHLDFSFGVDALAKSLNLFPTGTFLIHLNSCSVWVTGSSTAIHLRSTRCLRIW